MKQELVQLNKPPLFVPFNTRNQIINENCTKQKDIIELQQKTHYETLMSYMKEKQIFQGINDRIGKTIYSKARANFTVSNSPEAFKKNQVTTRYGLLRQINNWIKKDYSSSRFYSFVGIPFPLFSNASINRATSNIDDTGLKAYYKFNESSSPVVNLSQSAVDMGSIADLVVTGATFSQTGIIDDAVSFDQTDDVAEATGSTGADWKFLNVNNLKISYVFWYAKPDFDTGGNFHSTATFAGGTAGYGINAFANRNVQFLFGKTGTDLFNKTITAAMPNDANFHMIVVTGDDASGNATFSVDAGTRTTFSDLAITNTDDATSVLKVGRDNPLDAKLDEWSIWDQRLLTTDEEDDFFNGSAGLEIY